MSDELKTPGQLIDLAALQERRSTFNNGLTRKNPGQVELWTQIDNAAESVVSWWASDTKANLRRQLQPNEKELVKSRMQELEDCLIRLGEPERDEALVAILGMFGSFQGTARQAEFDATLAAANYLWTTREHPLWAIKQACADIRAGKTQHKAFCPSEAEFNIVVKETVWPYARQHIRLKAILEA